VRRLQESVLPSLEDNQQLSLRSRQAGQIGLLELIVVNRQGLDARRDLIEALAEFQSTRIALELAAGWPQEGQP
jgi:cobalt-zinc-cadmium efflux system outer membrane protein